MITSADEGASDADGKNWFALGGELKSNKVAWNSSGPNSFTSSST